MRSLVLVILGQTVGSDAGLRRTGLPGLRLRFVIILMTPDEPSGLYCADGLVITSIRSIELAGSCWMVSARLAPFIDVEGLPSMRICTF